MTGVKELLEAVTLYAKQPAYTREFGARVFKIARDEQGARLTYMKLTGGILKNKELLSGGKDSEKWSEKVNQIRIYSGEKYTAPAQVQDVSGTGAWHTGRDGCSVFRAGAYVLY